MALIYFQKTGISQHKNKTSSGKTKMGVIDCKFYKFETSLSQKTAYLWIHTILYILHKWNIIVCTLEYLQIHDIMSRNATFGLQCE